MSWAHTLGLLSICVITAAHAPAARASERRFTYTYESLVLNPGDVELEPWATFRGGRDRFYSRLDHRIELEAGLTDRLQVAWYLNFHATTQRTAAGLESEFEWAGVSNEWKLKLLDSVADPLGLALYFEWGAAPSELELEGKLIVDKRIGNFLVAFNAVVEPEWEFELEDAAGDVEAESEINFEFDLGLAYFVAQSFSLGLEVRNHNEYLPGEGYEHSALFAGPVLSYASEKWWATLTILPQIRKLKGTDEDAGRNLVLSEHERLETRLLIGVHL